MGTSSEPMAAVSSSMEVLPRPRRTMPLSGRLATGVLAIVVLVAVFVPLAPLPSPRTVDTARSLEPPLQGRLLEELPELMPREGEASDAWIERGFGDLGLVSRLMVQGRVALFGRWAFSGVLGRDELGRDLCARICWGARVSLAVALVAAVVTLLVGVPWGAVAGWAGGQRQRGQQESG